MPGPTPDPRSAPAGVPLPPEGTAGHGTDATPTRIVNAVHPPQRIGHYEVIQTLGRGGMSTVYLARDDRNGNEVALKVIPNGAEADPRDLARFHAEAEAVARLDHPNIVRLYEAGEAAGVAYLAMEYVPGGNLYKRITRDGPIRPVEAATLLEPLARAAHYAHMNGVIHRDLKPSNILLSPPSSVPSPQSSEGRPRTGGGGLGTPKIADFGLARQLDKSLRLTQSGVALGTPHYMAPEQAHGRSDLVGPPADVYALGAILYECLTGVPPFSGSSPLETMEHVVHQRPIPPGQRLAGIPPDLEAICLRCLEKSPGRRYPTAGALADALQLFLAGKPIGLPFDRPTERIVIPRRQRPPIALAAVAVALGLVAVTAAVTWLVAVRPHRGEARAARDQAAAATRAERRAWLEEAIARCEHGDIAGGLERMRTLPPDGDLPVREIMTAWESRVLAPATRTPPVRASAFAISQSGQLVATADGETVRILRLPDWTPVGEPWTADAAVTALAWGEGDDRLAVGTATGKVSVGDGSKSPFEPATAVDPSGTPVTELWLTSAEVRVAIGTRPTIRSYEGDEEPYTESIPDIGRLAAVALGPDGGLAAVTPAGAVKVFDARDGRWFDLPPDGDALVVAYARDGNVLAVGTKDGTVRLWDAVARKPLTDAARMNGPVTSLAVGMTATAYTVVASGNAAAAWTVARPFVAAPIHLPAGPEDDVLGVAFSAGPAALYVTSPSGVSLWKYGPGGRFRPLVSPRGRYSSWLENGRFAAALPTGAGPNTKESLVVAGSGGRMFHVEPDPDMAAADLARTTVGSADVVAMAAHPGGRVVAGGRDKDKKGMLRCWSHGLAGEPEQDGHFDGPVRASAFLPDGSAVVVGCEDGTVHLWDPTTGRDDQLRAFRSAVLAVAVNADGSRIFVGCADGTAHYWDRSTPKESNFVRHRAAVRAVAFLGADLLTASADGTARRWDAATGLPVGPPLTHADAITALALRGDEGPLVATGGRDHVVRVWRLP